MSLYPGRPRGPVVATDPLIRAVLEAVDKSGLDDGWIAKRAGISRNELSRWRSGVNSPRVRSISYVLAAIGAHAVVIDNNARQK
jgi:DNA-binding phage protein